MTNDHLWASGVFADAYMQRNLGVGAGRGKFWHDMIASLGVVHSQVLEVGCNVGANQQHLSYGAWGVDVNADVLALARSRYQLNTFLQASVAQRLPFRDQRFKLSFTCGVLIHIASVDLGRAIREIFRVSSKYVLLMEYAADEETVVEYHGEKAALWKRNWAYEVRAALANDAWKMTWTCPLGPDDDFDNVTAYLWERHE